MDQWIQSWDLALKDKETSDYSVGQVWARKGAEFYLVDSVRGHFSIQEVIDHIRRLTGRYPQAVAKVIEDKAMGPVVKAMLDKEVPGIIPYDPKGSKRSRVAVVEPVLAAGNIYVPQNPDGTQEDWVKDFVEECAQFDKGAYDDQVDALAQSIIFMLPAGWINIAKQHQEAIARGVPTKSTEEMLIAQVHAELRKDINKHGRKLVNKQGNVFSRIYNRHRAHRW